MMKDGKIITQEDCLGLAAKVEALIAHGTSLATAASMATGAMAIGSPVTDLCVEAVKRFNIAKEWTPAQHLANLHADDGETGYSRTAPTVSGRKNDMSNAIFSCDANPIDQIELSTESSGLHVEVHNFAAGDSVKTEIFLSVPSVLRLLGFLIQSKIVDTDFVLESIGQNTVEKWVAECNPCCNGAN